MVKEKFQYYKTEEGYASNKQNIPNGAIVFVEDKKYITTHNTKFGDISTVVDDITDVSDEIDQLKERQDVLEEKMDVLSITDDYPTEGSTHYVTSGGIYECLKHIVYEDSTVPNLIYIDTPITNINVVGTYRFPLVFSPDDYTAKIASIEAHTNIFPEYFQIEVDKSEIVLTVAELPETPFFFKIVANIRFFTAAGVKTMSAVSHDIGLNYPTPTIYIQNNNPEIREIGEYEFPFTIGPEELDADIEEITPIIDIDESWATVRIENSSIFVNVLKQHTIDYTISPGVDVRYASGSHAQSTTTSIVHPSYPMMTLTNNDVIIETGDYEFVLDYGEKDYTAVISSITASVSCVAEDEPIPTVVLTNDHLLTLTVAEKPHSNIKIIVVATVRFTSGEVIPVTCTKDVLGQEGLITLETNPEVMTVIAEYTEWSRDNDKITCEEVQTVTNLGTVFSQAQAEHPYTPLIPIDPSTMTPQEIADAEAQNVIIEEHNAEASLYHVKHFEELGYFTGLTEIPANAFEGCDELTTIIIPDGVSSIGESAFEGCSSLEWIANSYADGLFSKATKSNVPVSTAIFYYVNVSRPWLTIHSGAFEGTTIEAVGLDAYYVTTSGNPFKSSGVRAFAVSNLGTHSQSLRVVTRNSQIYRTNLRLNNIYTFIYKNGSYSDQFNYTNLGPILTDNDYNAIAFANVSDGEGADSSGYYISYYAIVAGVLEDAASGIDIAYRLFIDGNVGNGAFSGSTIKYINLSSNCASLGYGAFEDCRNVRFISCGMTNAPTVASGALSSIGADYTGEKHLNLKDLSGNGWNTGEWASLQQAGWVIKNPLSIPEDSVFSAVCVGKSTSSDYNLICNRDCWFEDDFKIAYPSIAKINIDNSTISTNYSFDEFQYCTSVTQLFGVQTSSSNTKLKSITFPDTINIFGGSTDTSLYYTRVTNLTIPSADIVYTQFFNTFYSTTNLIIEGTPSIRNAYSGNSATIYTNAVTISMPDIEVINFGLNDFSVTSISLPNALSIPNNFFSNKNTLQQVYIPKVTQLPPACFSSCTSLESIDLSNITSLGSSCFSNCQALTTIDASNVTTIGGNVFSGCTHLTTVVLPNTLTTIPEHCFSNCYALVTVNIPIRLQTIGTRAFLNCYLLPSLDFSNTSLSSIYYGAFEGCSVLTSIVLPSKNITIDFTSLCLGCHGLLAIDWSNAAITATGGASAFKNCTSLASVKINMAYTTCPSFEGCSHLSYIEGITTTNQGIRFLQILENGFKNCDSLVSVVLPSVTGNMNIGMSAFEDCSSLREINIPSNCTIVNTQAFKLCVELRQIVVNATTPPQLGSNVFENIPSASDVSYDRYLSIPASAEAAYRASSDWMYLVNTLGFTLQLINNL